MKKLLVSLLSILLPLTIVSCGNKEKENSDLSVTPDASVESTERPNIEPNASNDEGVYTMKKSDFYFSDSNGHSYGDGRIEFEVGKTVYMKVIISITHSSGSKKLVTGNITIPNINSVDSYYMSGQKITPEVDQLNNITYYPFQITTNEANDWEFVFEFVPNTAGDRCVIDLSFDSPIPSIYNKIRTVKFVDKVQ